MDVSIIIINYNCEDEIIDAVSTILRHTQNIDYEIIIVDNNSESINRIKNELKDKIHLIESETNQGFGKGCNLGAKHAKGKHLLFLNPDTLLINNSIAQLHQQMLKSAPDVACIGPLLINENNELISSYSNYRTLASEFRGCLQRIVPIKKKIQFSSNKVVDYITGAALMIKREAFIKVNGFDPDFFLFFEEASLSKKLNKVGYRNIHIDSVRLIHKQGQSTKKIGYIKDVYFEKSKYLYFRKYTDFNMYLIVLINIFSLTASLPISILKRVYNNKSISLQRNLALLKIAIKEPFNK